MNKSTPYDNGTSGKFPEEERKRVQELLQYGILDTPDEEEFDDITRVATYLCDVRSALINFLDYYRQWSKSSHGWDIRQIPRDQSICNHTIQQDQYLVVNDISDDPRFRHYSYVREKKVQFYAGVVLKSALGYNIGTLCVFDKEPRGISDKQLESLQILAKDIESKLELRLKREQLFEERKVLLSYQEQLRSLVYQLNTTEINQRQQLATELHDSLGQILALSKMKIGSLQKKQFTSDSHPDIDELKELINDAISYMLDLTSDLKPPPSIYNDLIAGIKWIAEKVRSHDLQVTIEDDGRPKPLDEEIRIMVVQSVRELLFNVIEHTSEKKATVRLKSSDNQLQVNVEDEGEGFSIENKKFSPGKKGRFGLFNIQERINLLGGSVEIDSKPGEGTIVTLQVPMLDEN